MKNILITGANGQLGTELRVKSANFKGFNFLFTSRKNLDITHKAEVEAFIDKHNINLIINAAAYTAVDRAEAEPQIANLVNNVAVGYLADIAFRYDIPIIHISTDYVFDGHSYRPYTEEDMTNPLSVYGKTKLDGEKKLYSYDKALIIRTSWLYSSYGKNFVKTILKLGEVRQKLGVVCDQIGTPTYAANLADFILYILPLLDQQDFPYGIYHFSDAGVASWFDFAYYIAKLAKLSTFIYPILTEDYPTAAKRPHYSVLNKQKLITTFGFSIQQWQESIQKCLFLIRN